MKSVTHEILDESIISRFIIFNPIINEIDQIMKRYINFFNKKINNIRSVVLKLLTTTNPVRHIRIIEKPNLDYFLISKDSILSRINQDRYYFLIFVKCVLLLVVLLEI